MITLSLEKEICYCFGNLEFWEPKICTKRWKEENQLQMSLSNPNLFDISSLESYIPIINGLSLKYE